MLFKSTDKNAIVVSRDHFNQTSVIWLELYGAIYYMLSEVVLREDDRLWPLVS